MVWITNKTSATQSSWRLCPTWCALPSPGTGSAHSPHVIVQEDLRHQIRQPRLVWGDSYALAELALHLDIVFLLWSEPLVPLRKFNSGYPFVSIPAPPVARRNKQLRCPCDPHTYIVQYERAAELPRHHRYIMLQHTRREHYNLITWNQQAVFRFGDLPPIILERWAHIWYAEADENSGSNGSAISGGGTKRKPPRKVAVSAPATVKRPKAEEVPVVKVATQPAATGVVRRGRPRPRTGPATVSRTKGAQKVAAEKSLTKASKCGRFGHFVDCMCHIKHKLVDLRTKGDLDEEASIVEAKNPGKAEKAAAADRRSLKAKFKAKAAAR
jgi:hypothetical protein